MRVLLFALVLLFIAPAATALSSIHISWGLGGISEIVAPAVSSMVTAHIVITPDSAGVVGVFVSIEFDASELRAIAGKELALVRLGMGGGFIPVSQGFTLVDNAVFRGDGSFTLGTVVFHVLEASGDDTDIDVIASLQNIGTDKIELGDRTLGTASFVGASILPEPTMGTLVIAGLSVLGYAGRQSIP